MANSTGPKQNNNCKKKKNSKNDSEAPDNFVSNLIVSLNDPVVADQVCSVLKPKIFGELVDKVARLEDEISTLKARLDSLTASTNEHFEEHPSSVPLQPTTSSSVDSQSKSLSLVSVHRELEEKRKRASNVIVHGLAPEEGTTDDRLFSNFMEKNLSVKPHFHHNKCRRLGKKTNGKIQPLQIVFSSTVAAADVLASSSELRRKAPGVFINPDLTPAEAQLAYEERNRRRERRQKQQQNNDQLKNENETVPSTGLALSINGTTVVDPVISASTYASVTASSSSTTNTTSSIPRPIASSACIRSPKNDISRINGAAPTTSNIPRRLSVGGPMDSTNNSNKYCTRSCSSQPCQRTSSASTLNADADPFVASVDPLL